MRRLTALFVLLLTTLTAQAQIGLPAGQAQLYPLVSSYVGPLDVVSGATACWALRACSNAYAVSGGAAATVAGNSTGSGTVHVTPAGGLKASDLTFCTTGGNTFCTIVSLVDQTGNGNAVSTTGVNEPTLTLSCLGSLPCWTSTGNQFLKSALVPSGSFPMTFSAVAERTAVNSSNSVPIVSMFVVSSGPAIDWNTSANNAFAGPGGGGAIAGCTVTDNAWHTFQAVLNTSTVLNCDGTDNTASGGTTASTTEIALMVIPAPNIAPAMTGNEAEVIWYNGTGISSTQRTNLCHNQFAYWGTSVSC